MRYTNRSLRRRRNSPDKWEVALTYTDPVTEEKSLRYYTLDAPNQRAAEKARDDLRFRLENEAHVNVSTCTVADYLDIHIKRRSTRLEASTIKGYKVDADRIKKYPIASMKVNQVKIDDVHAWLDLMIEEGYEGRTCLKSFRLLKASLKSAMADDVITKNPCDYVKPPRRKQTKIRFLRKNDRLKMIKLSREAPDNKLGLAIELALATGMRRGELCALRWSDIDETGVIYVHNALGQGDGGYYVKGVKNGVPRHIPLVSATYKRLLEYKARRMAECDELGVSFGDPYILGTPGKNSHYYIPDAFGKDFSAFVKMHNFNCTLHDLRHTFATFMIAEGADVATVASYLGDSIEVTLKNYATSDPGAKLAAMAFIEKGLGLDGDMDTFQVGK